MTGRELKEKLRSAGVASDMCRWTRIPSSSTLGQVAQQQGKPLGFWSLSLPRGERMKELAARVLAGEGIDVEEVEFLASHVDFTPEERAVIDAGGTVDGWTK